MLIISDNITTRSRKVAEALRPFHTNEQPPPGISEESAEYLRALASQCVAAGADVLNINLQQRYDSPKVMEFVIKVVEESVDCQLCLSANRADTLESGLRACRRPPIVNYISLDKRRLEELLPLAARYGADIVLFVADPAPPGSVEDALKSAAILVGAANESGIPNRGIFIDPGVFHVTSDAGQRRTKDLAELLPALAETFEPPVRTTCWINNVSTGAARRLRPAINSTFLAMLAGLGLSSAFVDALSRETMQTARLVKVFMNQRLYSDSDFN